MHLLIPIWGIVGAAIAVASSLLLNNIMRYVFLLWKYKMQPFNWKFLMIVGFYIVVYALLMLIPKLPFLLDIFIRSGLIVVLTMAFVILAPVSSDAMEIVNQVKKKLL
jgi:O-antigen/teichoic acid export membrane protein